MLIYQPDQNLVTLEHAIPWQFDANYYQSLSTQFCCSVYERQIGLEERELIYVEQAENQQIINSIKEARKAKKFAPLKKQFKSKKSWKERKQKWEFDNETDYHFGFGVHERYRSYEPTEVPRFEINLISLDFEYHYPLYIPSNIILGAIIDCIVKNPINDYKIYNSNYILSEEILQQRLDELYERDIDFRILVVENRKSNNKIFGYQFYHIIPPLSHFPKIYDFSTSISQKRVNPHSSNFAFFPSKPINQTSSPKTKQSNDNKK